MNLSLKGKIKMRPVIALIIISFCVLLIAVNFVIYTASKSSVAVHLPENYTVTAHSGSENTEDNSMEFLKKAVGSGVQILEVDLTFRKDGTPVLLHKDVAEDNEGLLFEDAVKYISENSQTVRVNLDLKAYSNLPEVVRILDKYSMSERCFYTGVKEENAETVRTEGAPIKYYLNISPDKSKKTDPDELNSVLEKVRNCGAVGINCNYKYASREMCELFHKNGLLVSYWTAKTKPVMLKLISIGPDNITTTKPTELNELIKKQSK